MPWVRYVKIEHAEKMVREVNEARTAISRDQARLRLHGYQQACEDMGLMWPGTELDHIFEDGDRPTCCGEYLDLESA